VPVHEQPAMRHLSAVRCPLPATESVARTHLALPMGPLLTEAQIDEVIRACGSGST
jgi:dTDP-4-amino-4,6-dideoxygalactose transaminase